MVFVEKGVLGNLQSNLLQLLLEINPLELPLAQLFFRFVRYPSLRPTFAPRLPY